MSDFFKPRTDVAPFNFDLLVLPEFTLMGLATTMEPLRAANRSANQELYRWRLLSHDGEPVRSSSGITIPAHARFEPDEARDALMIVASFNVHDHSRCVLARLRRAARRGTAIGGLDAGSWTLALAGLLDGKRATTHWEDLEVFAAAFPKIEVLPDRYVVDGARFTTGGATPALDMMLDLIAAHHGLNLANQVANAFIYDHQRPATAPQSIMSVGRLAATQPQLAKAIRLMEERIASPLAIAALAKHVGLSPRTLQQQFHDHLSTTPLGYYLDLRLDVARRMLQQSAMQVSAIADACGFGSASAFARAYRARFSQNPTEVRNAARRHET